jgi:hypothetical protein
MSFPSQRDVDALTNFEDDEFDALLSGGNSKLTPSKSPASSAASAVPSSAAKTSRSRARSSTVAVTDPSQSDPTSRVVALGDGRAAAAAPAPMTFGSTAFLSELQNRRKHVMHDNSLKAGASDDDADPPAAVALKPPRASAVSAPNPVGSQVASSSQAPGSKATETHAAQPSAAVQPAPVAAERQADASAPDASTCLRRLDRLPSTVEKCMKE